MCEIEIRDLGSRSRCYVSAWSGGYEDPDEVELEPEALRIFAARLVAAAFDLEERNAGRDRLTNHDPVRHRVPRGKRGRGFMEGIRVIIDGWIPPGMFAAVTPTPYVEDRLDPVWPAMETPG